MNILVVGGAGYIGSHCVRHIQAAGHVPVVLDNLSIGHRQSIPPGVKLYEANLGDIEAVSQVLKAEKIDLVMHFAAFTLVGESSKEPMKYYENNVIATLNLLKAMLDCGVKKFVFSSTAAVYGIPEQMPITEQTPKNPINPYGQTKLMIEKALADYAKAYGLSYSVFRYFNAAGAIEDGSIGECHPVETHLIPLAIFAAQGKRDKLVVMGDDYDTPDGTCLRDYIHVDDLSRAHVASFEKLASPGTELTYNLGTGKPMSVMEIIETVNKVTGLEVPYEIGPRRQGDPPILCADATKAQKELGWTVLHPQIDTIVRSAWNWHRSHPNGFQD